LNAIAAAADFLARARTGPALAGLPGTVRPSSLEEAEAIQHATLVAMGEHCGGWKLGRHGGMVFSAPIPASHLFADPGSDSVALPADRFIELELAIRFHTAIAAADLSSMAPGDLTGAAELATLFEFVRSRFQPSAETGPLDRIADCVANEGAMVRTTPTPWTLDMLDSPPAVTLIQDGTVIARREAGPHVAAPVLPLIEAWIARRRREGGGIAEGEVVTFGSLSGMPPIPTEGASYIGQIDGLEMIRCTVAPVI
jgi:2-keto-4-pentenoate hydratase